MPCIFRSYLHSDRYLPEQIVMQRHDILQGLDPHLVMELTPSTPSKDYFPVMSFIKLINF